LLSIHPLQEPGGVVQVHAWLRTLTAESGELDYGTFCALPASGKSLAQRIFDHGRQGAAALGSQFLGLPKKPIIESHSRSHDI
jgi:hypothetical protein